MSSRTLGRIVLVLLVIGSLIVLFPLALRLANPFATLVYNPAIDARILLLWPDRVELQPIRDLANFSPRPPNAAYTFLVPPERQAWVTGAATSIFHSYSRHNLGNSGSKPLGTRQARD